MKERLLIVVPAYNEEKSIEKVVGELIARGYDYLVVNDGSTDATAAICMRRGFRSLGLPLNLGLAGAIQAGMMYATTAGYDYVLQYDGDGQHSPEYIEMLREKAREGYDIVAGYRDFRESCGERMRRLGSAFLVGAIRIAAHRTLTDPTCGMRIYNRRMIELFAKNINFGPEPDTIAYLMRCGARVAEVPIKVLAREHGTSYLTSLNALKYMLRMAMSILMIQFARKRNGIDAYLGKEAEK